VQKITKQRKMRVRRDFKNMEADIPAFRYIVTGEDVQNGGFSISNNVHGF